jgi:hypothetical protein
VGASDPASIPPLLLAPLLLLPPLLLPLLLLLPPPLLLPLLLPPLLLLLLLPPPPPLSVEHPNPSAVPSDPRTTIVPSKYVVLMGVSYRPSVTGETVIRIPRLASKAT